ncbi:hypothetical protein EJ03DRAFT_53015 [Teratosphaeria nubilosa]|uniref:Uncharacterized protein n=1 Tax=Teratosphaeria nubilosa TaxID=161662 RepID=A0A6G1KT74_9PEZI|nr:hypothetical protein EJ03DRAFT_53015 [Teratosphaeria nubilosa]
MPPRKRGGKVATAQLTRITIISTTLTFPTTSLTSNHPPVNAKPPRSLADRTDDSGFNRFYTPSNLCSQLFARFHSACSLGLEFGSAT